MARSSYQPTPLFQLVINFALPIFILNRFSSESQLGPVRAMLLALAFPVVFELFNIVKRRKVSWVSAIAIGGILVTGAISLLGLSEGWLAARRSIPYLLLSLGLFIAILLKRPLVKLILPQLLDIPTLERVVQKKNVSAKLDKLILRTNYIFAVIFLLAAIGSYVLTRVVITGEAGTPQFNEEYSRLRVLSIPFGTVPLFVMFAASLVYLFNAIEKLTGLDADSLMKKKS